jgi:mannose-6-phosphate isomerase-like protein (cupin superfamily)
MFKIIDPDKAPCVPMENGRGETVLLVDQSLGTEKIDLHLNRLVPGGPNGSLHRHSRSDNIYIVRAGEGRLQIENATHVIRTGQVIYIPAGMRHSLSNVASEVLEIFEIYTPAGRDFDFVIE